MRIAQMTWFTYRNYGTLLQAYALQNVMHGMGHEIDLVNYDPVAFQERHKAAIRRTRLVKTIRRWQMDRLGTSIHHSRGKEKAFKDFIDEELSLSRPVRVQAEFDELDTLYDAFVCGSDQIWSPRCFDARYYLDFVSDGRKKIAYAPSFGCEHLSDEDAKVIRPLVTDFEHLSNREVAGAELVTQMTGRPCEVVIDPTLLLDREAWRSIGSSTPLMSRPFCLCYFLGSFEGNWEKAREIAHAKGLPVLIIPAHMGDRKREGIVPDDIGPREFLGLFASASYVCTDSFHGLVFSTLFQKAVTVFERFDPDNSASQNVRIYNFLTMFGLTERLCTRKMLNTPCDTSDILYSLIDEAIAAKREKSLEFLHDSLQVVESEVSNNDR